MADTSGTPTESYYEEAWRVKLDRPEYATLERRWRSRWDFVVTHMPEESHTLDMGCGDGVLGEQLIRVKNCVVTGLDVSDFALARARERGVDACKCDISMSSVPFDEDSFDAVTLSCVLEHIALPEHALTEAARVVKDGGYVLVTLPNPLTWKIRIAFLRGKFHSDFLHSRPGEGLHYRFWPVRDGLEKMLQDLYLPFTLTLKSVDVKNPRKYSRFGLRWRRRLIVASPALFGEYTHYILRKDISRTTG